MKKLPAGVAADPGAAGYAGFAGRSNAFIVRTGAEGHEISSRRFESGDNVIASGAAMAADGEIVLLAYVLHYPLDDNDIRLLKVDVDGNELSVVTYGESDTVDTAHVVTETAKGRSVCIGWRVRDLHSWTDDILLAAFDRGGAFLWESVTPSVKHNMHEGFFQHPDGSYVVVGSAAMPGGSFRIQLVKMDPDRT